MEHDNSGATTRRRVLLGIGSGAAVALAGCLGGTDEGADNVPVQGNPDADVVLEVYEDMGCPACRQYIESGFDDIRAGYIDEGLIRYEHRDYITTGIAAEHAASAAREMLERHGNDAFWEFKSAMYENQERLRGGVPELFGEIADDLGYDPGPIEAAGDARDHQSAVEADIDRGRSIGVQATPSFVLDEELIDAGGRMNQRVATVMQELDQALSE